MKEFDKPPVHDSFLNFDTMKQLGYSTYVRRDFFVWLLTSLFWVCSTVSLYAQAAYTPQSVPNVRLQDRYNHVSNPDDILSKVYVDNINHELNALEDKTGVQVAVVALTSVKDYAVKEFATRLFELWKIGEKGKDNGLLVLLVTDPEQREVTFETGYGIEGILPDATCYQIQQKQMIPFMKEGNYDVGMLRGIQTTVKYLNGDIKETESDSFLDGEDWFWLILFGSLAVGWFVFFVLIPFLFARIVEFFQNLYRKRHPKLCPECGQKTLAFQRDEVTKKPTAKSKGSGCSIYECTNCGHVEKEKYTIEKLKPISFMSGKSDRNRHKRGGSGSGGSFGGRSGGSWGGGSSGGGGASSRF